VINNDKLAKIQKAEITAARSVNKWLRDAGYDASALPAPTFAGADATFNAVAR
jgi:hypothetical protein